jgi:methionyl-tRNA formyltransferase
MTTEDMRVVFMGSPEFAVPSLQALAKAGYNVVASVSQPDRPAGRGGRVHAPEVKLAATDLGIETVQPESLRGEDVREKLASFAADIFVVAAYGKILPRAVLALPTRGCINVHGSLLPRWRGPSPIAAAILAGDPETGVSIMELEPKMDAGPVIARRALPISPTDTTGGLEPRLAALGAATLIGVLPAWFERQLPAEPQDESLVTYCQLLTKADGWLNAAMTAAEAERAVRAYNPWPGAFVEYRGERLAIWSAHISPEPQGLPPGATAVIEHAPAIAFVDGMLVLDEVQRSGARRTTGLQFLNGQRGQLAPEVVLA